MTFNQVVEGVGKTIDGAGVAVIVVGALAATVIAGTRARETAGRSSATGLSLDPGSAIDCSTQDVPISSQQRRGSATTHIAAQLRHGHLRPRPPGRSGSPQGSAPRPRQGRSRARGVPGRPQSGSHRWTRGSAAAHAQGADQHDGEWELDLLPGAVIKAADGPVGRSSRRCDRSGCGPRWRCGAIRRWRGDGTNARLRALCAHGVTERPSLESGRVITVIVLMRPRSSPSSRLTPWIRRSRIRASNTSAVRGPLRNSCVKA